MKDFAGICPSPLVIAIDAAEVGSAGASCTVQLVPALTLIGAASERMGGYESALVVETVDAKESVRRSTSAEVPDPNGGRPGPVSVNRDVHTANLRCARACHSMISVGEGEFPDTPGTGVSAAVFGDLRAKGNAPVTLKGSLGGFGGISADHLPMLAAQGAKGTGGGYLTATDTISAVEPRPAPCKLIVNEALVSVPAWHVTGERLAPDSSDVPVEEYIAANPSNSHRCALSSVKTEMQIVRISLADADPNDALERPLAEHKRAVVYGVCFNSVSVEPRFDNKLLPIVAVMTTNRQWELRVKGFRENVGSTAPSRDLLTRPVAAARLALVGRGIADKCLVITGCGIVTQRRGCDARGASGVTGASS